ncbi:MAG: hypothetical protein KatS3mg102_2606 [Planctomycetota bacterium]|nr:MAG: hypothetical protein KatS3mg102_2606 [Planctomycetota bacterium]
MSSGLVTLNPAHQAVAAARPLSPAEAVQQGHAPDPVRVNGLLQAAGLARTETGEEVIYDRLTLTGTRQWQRYLTSAEQTSRTRGTQRAVTREQDRIHERVLTAREVWLEPAAGGGVRLPVDLAGASVEGTVDEQNLELEPEDPAQPHGPYTIRYGEQVFRWSPRLLLTIFDEQLIADTAVARRETLRPGDSVLVTGALRNGRLVAPPGGSLVVVPAAMEPFLVSGHLPAMSLRPIGVALLGFGAFLVLAALLFRRRLRAGAERPGEAVAAGPGRDGTIEL